MNRFRKQTAVLLLAALSLAAVPTSATALDLGDILKKGALIVGGGALVKALAEPLDDFINTVTFNRNAKFQGYTKVVPIVSIGDGTHIGAAQVGGQAKSAVERTQAAAQLEAEFKGVRVRILIPIDSINPIERFNRVQGVGVTAMIDADI
ncbi:hypothetical protein FF3_00042 [Fretibacterium fastidiosum]|uniref:hypothetical protein n=1 Tax=Fretibacterium fastidiosum TaxID=651822 RepID=UPI0038FCAFAB